LKVDDQKKSKTEEKMLKEQIKEYKQIQKDHQKNLGPSEQDLMSPD